MSIVRSFNLKNEKKPEKEKKKIDQSIDVNAPDVEAGTINIQPEGSLGHICDGDVCSLNTQSNPVMTTHVCDGDICSIRPAVYNGDVSDSTSQNPFVTIEEEKKIESLGLPSDLWNAIKDASRKGCLYAYLCTLSEEFVTEKLKARKYSEKQIKITNEIIKSLIILSLTQSGKSIISPVVKHVLMEYSYISERNAGKIASITLPAIEAIAIPTNAPKIAMGFVAGMGGSMIGNSLGRLFYRASHNDIAKNTFNALQSISDSLFNGYVDNESEANQDLISYCPKST